MNCQRGILTNWTNSLQWESIIFHQIPFNNVFIGRCLCNVIKDVMWCFHYFVLFVFLYFGNHKKVIFVLKCCVNRHGLLEGVNKDCCCSFHLFPPPLPKSSKFVNSGGSGFLWLVCLALKKVVPFSWSLHYRVVSKKS